MKLGVVTPVMKSVMKLGVVTTLARVTKIMKLLTTLQEKRAMKLGVDVGLSLDVKYKGKDIVNYDKALEYDTQNMMQSGEKTHTKAFSISKWVAGFGVLWTPLSYFRFMACCIVFLRCVL